MKSSFPPVGLTQGADKSRRMGCPPPWKLSRSHAQRNTQEGSSLPHAPAMVFSGTSYMREVAGQPR
eukprot:5433068-Karenia_brevis.AAC.1